MSEQQQKWGGFILPPEVEQILDEAAANGEHLAVVFTKDSVQLTLADGRTILKEFKWDNVNEFSALFLKNVMSHTLENEPPAEDILQ